MELQKENIIQSQGKIPSTSKELHCNFCPRKFTEQRDLVRHVTIIHPNVIVFQSRNTSLVLCDYCGLRFTEHKNLARHVSDVHHDITHISQDNKPSTSKELHCNEKENIEGHTSVIHCNYCGERFTEHKNLARHVSDVHHDIPQRHRVYLNKKS